MVPAVGRRSPSRMRMVVDFPERRPQAPPAPSLGRWQPHRGRTCRHTAATEMLARKAFLGVRLFRLLTLRSQCRGLCALVARRPRSHDAAMAGSRHNRAASRPGSNRSGLPPRWFMVGFWHAHRALLRLTHGRLGLWRPKRDRWGALWLTTTGRRSGQPRRVVVGYFEDGENLVTMAMNGWGAAEPAWWLNLQSQPEATVRTRAGVRRVRAHRAERAERERLWARWSEIDNNLDAYAALRPTEPAVVVFEPADSDGPAAGGVAVDSAAASSKGGTR
jgi:F420H(2)-dependent quinone reductase